MLRPLAGGWRLEGEGLPERLITDDTPGFILPGAQELAGFADLLGADDAPAQQEAPGAAFSLPAMLPEDMRGQAILSREIDFSQLSADGALLCFDLLCGSGDVLLDSKTLARFEGGALRLDVSDALRLSRKQTLTLRFDEVQGAGVPLCPTLQLWRRACIERLTLTPHTDSQTMTLRAQIHARRAGDYRLIVCPPGNQADAAPRRMHIYLREGERHTFSLTLSVPAPRFVPGVPYAAPSLRVMLLFERPRSAAPQKRAFMRRSADTPPPASVLDGCILCESRTLLCGYPAEQCPAWVPLDAQDCARNPQALIGDLRALGIRAVSLPESAPQALLGEMALAGILVCLPAARAAEMAQYPCVIAQPDAPAFPEGEEVVWHLCAMIRWPRPAPQGSAAALLQEAAGKPVSPDDDTLRWLSALLTRLRAEAFRQGFCTGPLCREGAWRQSDTADALKAALSPVHLSVLPMRGAWWAHARLSADVCAFFPDGADMPARADIRLEDEEGNVLASLSGEALPGKTQLGTLEAQLPGHACVLTLTGSFAAGQTCEQISLPVYVGLRGPLESVLL